MGQARRAWTVLVFAALLLLALFLPALSPAPVEATPGTINILVSSGLNQPKGVAIDGSGNLYVAGTMQDQRP